MQGFGVNKKTLLGGILLLLKNLTCNIAQGLIILSPAQWILLSIFFCIDNCNSGNYVMYSFLCIV
ncbi:MAG: hypothetical protein D3924_04300 [Candidatus Electrothrix sp. AR4]|nr:hypothetical protein [Candidatus Electrothrix sp. AR4]